MELVYMDGKKEPYTLSSIVAECTGLQHHTITKTIRKHQARFEQFGKVGFKIQAMAFRNKKNTPKKRVRATKKGLAITTPQSLSH